MALSRDKIISHAGVFDTREVHVPKWADGDGDDVVLVRGLTAREWELHQKRTANGKDGETASAALLVHVVLAPDKTKLFEPSDAGLIAELGVGEVSKLLDAVLDLSGLTDESQQAIEGNSAAAQSGDSSST